MLLLSSNLLSKVHLLRVKLVQLVLRSPRGILLLLDLKMGDLGLLHHVLEKHLLVEVTRYIGFVGHINLLLSCATSLEHLICPRIKTLHELCRLSALVTKQDHLI